MTARRHVPAKLRDPWRDFTAAVEVRLAAGARAYGDVSPRAKPTTLAGEVEQELLDVLGWGVPALAAAADASGPAARGPATGPRRGMLGGTTR